MILNFLNTTSLSNSELYPKVVTWISSPIGLEPYVYNDLKYQDHWQQRIMFHRQVFLVHQFPEYKFHHHHYPPMAHQHQQASLENQIHTYLFQHLAEDIASLF